MIASILALIAVLSPLCAAQAATTKPPMLHRMPQDQYACQNLLDMQELESAIIRKKRGSFEEIMRKRGTEEAARFGMTCMKIPKGTTVTIRKRYINYECLDLKDGVRDDCFFTNAISGEPYDDKSSWRFGGAY